MVGDATQRLVVGVIGLVRRLFGGVCGFNYDVCGVLGKGTQVGDVLGVFGNDFCHDIRSSCKGFLRRVEAGFLVDIRCGGIDCRTSAFGVGLHDDHVCERFEARFARLLRACHTLLAIGLVEVFDALELLGFADLFLELGCELALSVDKHDDVFLALLEIAQVTQAFIESAERDIVHASGGFFAVTRDERNGVSLVDELDGGLDVGDFEIELLGELSDKIHKAPCIYWCV